VSNIKTDVKIVDNVFVKMYQFKEIGDTHHGHAHVFDHITLLAYGSLLMKHTNGETTFTAPHLIVTPKGVNHQFIATEPNTVFCCIHAIREGSEVSDVASQNISPEQAFEFLSRFKLTID
jgi:quercetin dioxygenase-like cupin family protein